MSAQSPEGNRPWRMVDLVCSHCQQPYRKRLAVVLRVDYCSRTCRKAAYVPIGIAHKESRKDYERAYNTWDHMKRRCFNPRSNCFRHYGGRGITVCARWMSFENFLADMGYPPPDTSLGRINNDGNYEPGNCRWADKMTQMLNCRKSKIIEFRGMSMNMSGWSRHFGLKRGTFSSMAKRRGVQAALELYSRSMK